MDENKHKIRMLFAVIEGLEEEGAKEAEEFGLKTMKKSEGSGYVEAEGGSNDILIFLHNTKCASNVMIRLGSIKYSDENEFEEIDYDTELSSKLKNAKFTFRAKSVVGDRADEIIAGEFLHDAKGFPVNLSSPDIMVGTLRTEFQDSSDYPGSSESFDSKGAGSLITFGLLLNRKDLSKRDYRLYQITRSLNACVYSSALVLAGANTSEIFLDPIAGEGSFCIEYYYRASKKTPLEFDRDKIDAVAVKTAFKTEYDFDNYVQAEESDYEIYCNDSNSNHLMRARQNSRLAGCEKNIRFSKNSLEWAYLKMPENKYTLIATQLPLLSKHFPEKKYERLSGEYAVLCKELLSGGNRAITISNESRIIKESMQNEGLKAVAEKKIMRGSLEIYIMVFSKKGDNADSGDGDDCKQKDKQKREDSKVSDS